MLHNLGALEAFQRRTTYGHNLSERVWSIAKQFERHIELSLSIGISEGRSAADISRDVRVYLNEPDKLFRRVRNAFGNLTLSKVAQAYHPGQGVYRSSYPKSFKFIGWHPNCKCYAVPIIANEGTDRDFWEEPLNEVKDVPDNFKRWVEDNTERIEKAKNLPYFIGENKKTLQ